jgi:hypothetical protein
MIIRKGRRSAETSAERRRNGITSQLGVIVKMSRPSPKRKNVSSDDRNPANAILWS